MKGSMALLFLYIIHHSLAHSPSERRQSACIHGACFLRCGGGEGWIIDWGEELREEEEEEEEDSMFLREFPVTSLLSTHSLNTVTSVYGASLRHTLRHAVWTPLPRLLSRCVFGVLWTIQSLLCRHSFWTICFSEALSKQHHALLLFSLLSFSGDDFLWQLNYLASLTCLTC